MSITNYMDIGHDTSNFIPWVFYHMDIKYGPKGSDEFHRDYDDTDYGGRVDLDKNVISLYSVYSDSFLDYIVDLLKIDYPDFPIYFFEGAFGKPRKFERML